MSNNLTDILVQQFKKSFELTLLEAQLVQTAVFVAYGTMAIPAALLMRRFGYRVGLLTGLLLFGAGTLLFWPAAVAGRYSAVSAGVVYRGLRAIDSGDGGESADCAVRAAGDIGAAAEFCAELQSAGIDGGCAVRDVVHLFRSGARRRQRVAAMRADGTYASLSARRDHAGGASCMWGSGWC